MILNTCMLTAALLAATPSQVAAAEKSAEEQPVLERARLVLETALRDRYPNVERFEIALLRTDAPQWKSKDVVVDEIVPSKSIALSRRSCTIVRFHRQDGVIREKSIWWSVKAFRPVPVTRREIHAREPIAEHDVVVQTYDIAGLAELAGDIAALGSNRRSRRFLSAGVPLLESDLDYLPEVTREQTVMVRIGTRTVSIETIGIAQQEGRTGQIIHVANPVNRMRYPARVTGAGEVSVGVPSK